MQANQIRGKDPSDVLWSLKKSIGGCWTLAHPPGEDPKPVPLHWAGESGQSALENPFPERARSWWAYGRDVWPMTPAF